MSSRNMKQISPILRCSEPVPSFLQGSLIWIRDYEQLIDGVWQNFTSTCPRRLGHSYDEDALEILGYHFLAPS